MTDWNQTPAALRDTGFLDFTRGAICATAEPTCLLDRGSLIAFLVVDPVLAPAIRLARDLDVPWAPHLCFKNSVGRGLSYTRGEGKIPPPFILGEG